MTSPTLELQGAIVAALKGSAEVTALAGARVYDHVPRTTAGDVSAGFPFVALSGWQEITEDADCIDGCEIFVTIDVWSRGVGMPEAHRLATAVKDALHNVALDLTDNALVLISHDNTRTGRDPDGLTTHAALDFRAFVEQPA